MEKSPMNRRKFMQVAGITAGAYLLGGCSSEKGAVPSVKSPQAPRVNDAERGKVYVGKNDDPRKALLAAVGAFGGLTSVVKPGDKVLLKPNAAWARRSADAATTDPAVVGGMVRLCKEAGASKVTLFEYTIDRPAGMVLGLTGIGKAASDAGAEVVLASSESDFAPFEIPHGKMLKSDTIAKAVLDADVIINIPKAKSHSQTKLTLGMKNLMGIIWDRQSWHTGPDLDQYIADYASAAPVHLTVIDASKILLTNGPKGPGKTKSPGEIIVSVDPVAADSYACGLFGLKISDIAYISMAAELGLGEADINKINIVRA